MELLICIIIMGVGATAMTDLWAIVRQHLIGVSPPNYGMVGRWLAWMPRGRFRHASMAAVPRVPGEHVIGWTAHYLIGVAFAGLLLAIGGVEWLREPTVWLALLVGIATVAAPFFVMQPGMGSGIAASRTPRPNAARLQSLITHAVFGLGLYAAGWIARWIYLSAD